jgi:hypothetical protein
MKLAKGSHQWSTGRYRCSPTRNRTRVSRICSTKSSDQPPPRLRRSAVALAKADHLSRCALRLVDPLLNRACVVAIIVVMAAAVLSAIADVCNESVRAVRRRTHENAPVSHDRCASAFGSLERAGVASTAGVMLAGARSRNTSPTSAMPGSSGATRISSVGSHPVGGGQCGIDGCVA